MKAETTNGFRGPYWFLSNFYPCICRYQDFDFPSSEHLYQFLKTDPGPKGRWWREKIAYAEHPAIARKLANNDKHPKAPGAIDNWTGFRMRCMRHTLRVKFSDPTLCQWLLDTQGIRLVEYNHWGDTFWGVCQGQGENYLGRLLMELRDQWTV